jgi:DNA-binding transcriptional MocR family regulator
VSSTERNSFDPTPVVAWANACSMTSIICRAASAGAVIKIFRTDEADHRIDEQRLEPSRDGVGARFHRLLVDPEMRVRRQRAALAGFEIHDVAADRASRKRKRPPRLAKDRRYGALADYHPPEGPSWARSAVAEWLLGVVGDGDAGRVVLTDGAQHGLACVLRALAQRGDVILADSVTYQGISALCRSQGLDLRGLPFDREGMRPDTFEAACATLRPRAVFLVPTLHNPTTVTLSEERRRALAAIARRHNVLIIEDDVYRPLLDRVIPSFATLEPELTIHISGLSKCIAPGLRYGFVVAPRAVLGNVAAALRVDCWSISPLTALVATLMLEEGTAKQIIEVRMERSTQGRTGRSTRMVERRRSCRAGACASRPRPGAFSSRTLSILSTPPL